MQLICNILGNQNQNSKHYLVSLKLDSNIQVQKHQHGPQYSHTSHHMRTYKNCSLCCRNPPTQHTLSHTNVAKLPIITQRLGRHPRYIPRRHQYTNSLPTHVGGEVSRRLPPAGKYFFSALQHWL